ncbi:MAG TPA: hypothetical protein VFB10_14665 [Candidatus Dormibacteraeota bacterium]|nr:hypothetical protein [Candidatus Dormibacteraeota bacterium]
MFVRFKLWKVGFYEWQLEREWRKIARRAKKEKNPGIEEEWHKARRWEHEELGWTRREIVSRDLMREASNLLLPTPSYADKTKWDESAVNMGFGAILTKEATNELRFAIRQERRARRETIEFYLKVIATVLTIGTGIVGALIGLFAILKHR